MEMFSILDTNGFQAITSNELNKKIRSPNEITGGIKIPPAI